jgi:hypothetical protein
MKRLFLCLFLMCFALPLMAADVKLQWDDPNAASAAVTKYTMYQATVAAGPFTKVADITAPTKVYTIIGLTPGTYYFRVTATNSWGESGASNVVNTPPGTPTSPSNLIFVVTLMEDGSYIVRLVDASTFFRNSQG